MSIFHTIDPPECGKNQDVIFVQDITQSFTIPNFRPVMHALQFIVGALKTQASNNVNVGLVLYPYIFDKKMFPDRGASLNISLTENCLSAVKSLENLGYSIYNSEYHGEVTHSYDALEFIGNNIINDMQQPTTVLTITDGVSTPSDNSINRITTAINKIRQSRPSTRFYAAGVEIGNFIRNDNRARFINELKALGGSSGDDSHHTRSNSDIVTFTRDVIDLLVNASVLCPNQSKLITIFPLNDTYIAASVCVWVGADPGIFFRGIFKRGTAAPLLRTVLPIADLCNQDTCLMQGPQYEQARSNQFLGLYIFSAIQLALGRVSVNFLCHLQGQQSRLRLTAVHSLIICNAWKTTRIHISTGLTSMIVYRKISVL